MSIEINSTNKKAEKYSSRKQKDTRQFTELSDLLYSNRHTHDKSFYLSVDEIDFTIGINSILNEKEDKEKLYELIRSNYYVLFDLQFVERIKALTEEDFKEVCVYNFIKDRYSGLEYHVLRHLVDYHLNVFERDLGSGKLRDILKLKTEKGNLIVQCFPVKSTDDTPVSYLISLLYLVLLHLYKYANQEADFRSIIKHVFSFIRPIATKVVYSLTIKADDNYTWFKQLGELKSNYPFFKIKQKGRQIQYFFNPKEHCLVSTLNCPVENKEPSSQKTGYRSISCAFTLNKDNSLQCHTTIVSKDMVDCVFATQIDEPDELASMFSRLSDNEEYYHANYSILLRMLTYTKQFAEVRDELRVKIGKLIRKGCLDIIGECSQDDKITYLTTSKLPMLIFKDVEIMNRDDMLIPLIIHYLNVEGVKNGCIPYVIIVRELLGKDIDFVGSILEQLNSKDSEIIRKVLNKVEKVEFPFGFTLNNFYNEV